MRLSTRLIVVGALIALGATTLVSALPRSTQSESRAPLGTGFTYQGRIEIDGVPQSGTCGLRFTLWDAGGAGSAVGAQQATSTQVTNGTFSVVVNAANQFGAGAFTGETRWLETEARCPDAGGYTSLGRTQLTPVPYATFAMDSGKLGGFAASDYARYERIVLITAGGTAAANGQQLMTKLGGIQGASATNRYLVLLEPGVFDVTILAPGPGIDLAGVQPGTSIIRGDGEDSVVQLTTNVTVSNVVIETTGVAGIGVRLAAGTYTFRDVTIRSNGLGIQATDDLSEIMLERSAVQVICEISSCVGIDLTSGASLTSHDSTISLSPFIPEANLTGIAALNGADVDFSGGSILINAGISLGNSRAVSASSLASDVTLRGTRVDVMTFDTGLGIIVGGDLVLDDVALTVTAAAGSGWAVNVASEIAISDTDITADGIIAVYLGEGSSGVIEHSNVRTLTAQVPVFAGGGAAVIEVRQSVVSAGGGAAVGSGSAGPKFSFSSLRGAAMTFSAIQPVCAAVTDETNAFFASTCP